MQVEVSVMSFPLEGFQIMLLSLSVGGKKRNILIIHHWLGLISGAMREMSTYKYFNTVEDVFLETVRRPVRYKLLALHLQISSSIS